MVLSCFFQCNARNQNKTTSPTMTSFSENNNSFRVDVKVPRPCRPDNGPVVDDEYWDRGATAMVLADADEGFVCDAAASVVDRNTKTSGSSIASDHTTKTSTSSIQSAESNTSTSSIQSAESGLFWCNLHTLYMNTRNSLKWHFRQKTKE